MPSRKIKRIQIIFTRSVRSSSAKIKEIKNNRVIAIKSKILAIKREAIPSPVVLLLTFFRR
jgi:hypothetical protein